MYGKIKKFLKEKCPYCNNPLVIRTYSVESHISGTSIEIDEDYISCSNKSCDYERTIKQKRRKIDERKISRDLERKPYDKRDKNSKKVY